MPEDVGRLTPHVTSISLMLSFSLPQLPPPAPLQKPPLTEPSLAQSTLSDTRSISCVPRATNWPVQPRAFAGTTAPGAVLMPSVKVSLTGSFVQQDQRLFCTECNQFYSFGLQYKAILISLRMNEIYFIFLYQRKLIEKGEALHKKSLEGDQTTLQFVAFQTGQSGFFSSSGAAWQRRNASYCCEGRHSTGYAATWLQC